MSCLMFHRCCSELLHGLADGVLNSLSSALTDPSLAYFLPCLAFTLFYWKKERREQCPKFIPRCMACSLSCCCTLGCCMHNKLGCGYWSTDQRLIHACSFLAQRDWMPIFVVNAAIMAFFAGTQPKSAPRMPLAVFAVCRYVIAS